MDATHNQQTGGAREGCLGCSDSAADLLLVDLRLAAFAPEHPRIPVNVK